MGQSDGPYPPNCPVQRPVVEHCRNGHLPPLRTGHKHRVPSLRHPSSRGAAIFHVLQRAGRQAQAPVATARRPRVYHWRAPSFWGWLVGLREVGTLDTATRALRPVSTWIVSRCRRRGIRHASRWRFPPTSPPSSSNARQGTPYVVLPASSYAARVSYFFYFLLFKNFGPCSTVQTKTKIERTYSISARLNSWISYLLRNSFVLCIPKYLGRYMLRVTYSLTMTF